MKKKMNLSFAAKFKRVGLNTQSKRIRLELMGKLGQTDVSRPAPGILMVGDRVISTKDF